MTFHSHRTLFGPLAISRLVLFPCEIKPSTPGNAPGSRSEAWAGVTPSAVSSRKRAASWIANLHRRHATRDQPVVQHTGWRRGRENVRLTLDEQRGRAVRADVSDRRGEFVDFRDLVQVAAKQRIQSARLCQVFLGIRDPGSPIATLGRPITRVWSQ